MVLSYIPLTNTHLLCLTTRTVTGGVNLRDPETRDNLLKGPAGAFTDRGEVFAACGIIPMWKGVGHGWAIVSVPTGARRLLYVSRQVRIFLQEYSAEFPRIQTTICADFVQGLAWATAVLGFTPEGVHAKYDEHGHTHISMARVK